MKTTTMSFETWLAKVDRILEARCGMGSSDLADCCYSDWFDDGMTPGQAAREALAENGADLD